MKNRLHVKAPGNWVNDPNGMIYYKGQYHLFYQHFPYAPRWGTMALGPCGESGSDSLGACRRCPVPESFRGPERLLFRKRSRRERRDASLLHGVFTIIR